MMFNSTCQSERERSPIGLLKRMLEPIMKSKSQRNPSLRDAEIAGNTVIDPSSISSHGVLCRSLTNDFLKVSQKVENGSGSIGSNQASLTFSLPAHLHAILKLESKHIAPQYEFVVDDPEYVLSAKTWRSGSAFSPVYTFHGGKKMTTSSSGRVSKEWHGQSPSIIGQMQVSCYLCSEVSETGSLDNSTVTKFILYDIAQARRIHAAEEAARRPLGSTQPATFKIADSLTLESPFEAKNSVGPEKCRHNRRHPLIDFDSDPSTFYPLAPADLHPHLEIAAIVTQIPFNKKETKLKPARKEIRAKKQPQLCSASTAGQGIDVTADCMSSAHVKVVTQSGTHCLPRTEESGALPLLDRWRFGGGCDCGGWDMACPIVVFDNRYANDAAADCSLMRDQQPILLFTQGRKEKIPALSITADGKGQYSVNFHAQLSALQAFSICIAVLHSSEVALALGHEKRQRQRLSSNSLKLLLGEEESRAIARS